MRGMRASGGTRSSRGTLAAAEVRNVSQMWSPADIQQIPCNARSKFVIYFLALRRNQTLRGGAVW